MARPPFSSVSSATPGPQLDAYLMGVTDYDACLALQQRLVYELSGRDDGRIHLLLCEHHPIVTVGREGSWSDLPDDEATRATAGLQVRWVNRGGGTLLHLPGQLAIYPIVPLFWYGWTVGEYLLRLQDGLRTVLTDLGITARPAEDSFDVWGRTGVLASVGAAVRGWTTCHGAFVNLGGQLDLLRRYRTPTAGRISTLSWERRGPVSPTRLREATIRRLSVAFGVSRYHVHVGHPLLRTKVKANHETAARAG